MSLNARVFISCGQRSDELVIAKDIFDKLYNMGFEPYIALVEQTLLGIKENLFKRLEESEYFIFIDFKRERLARNKEEQIQDTKTHRGSLFSNQELAIATFLQDIDVIAFQEMGVKREDGILKYIQANCYPFSDRKILSDLVIKKVVEKGWISFWRKELRLERDELDYKNARSPLGQGRWYHLKVKNLHRRKIARNCIAYVERIVNLSSDEIRHPELVELKWKGTKSESISIPPESMRYLDAFYVLFNRQHVAHIGINPFLVDWQGYLPTFTLVGPGDYYIDYILFSEGFSDCKVRCSLHLGKKIEEVRFEVIN